MTKQELPLLEFLKKSNKSPVTGDLFVVKRKDNGKYLYGLVVEDKCTGVFSNTELLIIYIYKYESDSIEPIPELKKEDLLIAPEIVGFQPWRAGYFLTVKHIEKEDIDKFSTHTFWDPLSKNEKGDSKYFNEYGEQIGFGPRNRLPMHAMSNHYMVDLEIRVALGLASTDAVK